MKARNEKREVLGFLLAVVGFLAPVPMASAIVPTVVEPGGTYFVGKSAATQGGNGTTVFDLRDGATLVVTNSAAGNSVWNAVFSTNGTATVDLSAPGVCSPAFSLVRGIRCGETGALRIKTSDGFGYASFGGDAYYGVVDARDVALLNADGSVNPNGILHFRYRTCVVRMPTNCLWDIDNQVTGTDVHFAGTHTVLGDADIKIVGGTQLNVDTADAILPDQRVVVKSGSTLIVRTCTVRIGENNDVSYVYSGQVPMDTGFRVDLDSATSTLRLQELAYWRGAVTGIGRVEVLSPLRLTADVAPAISVAGGASLTVEASAHVSTVELGANATLEVSGTVDSVVLTPGEISTVRVLPGAKVTIVGNDADLRLENLGGKVVFTDSGEDWKKEVSCWFDPSRTDSLRYVGYYAKEDQYKHPGATSSGYPIYEQVLDWRNPDATYSLFNIRTYSDHHFGDGLYPCLIPYDGTGGEDDLKYISFVPGTGLRRLPIGKNNSLTENGSIAARMVVMVFGSQGGGGKAVIGTKAPGAFGRTGTDWTDGITTNTAHDIWVNGEKLEDPTARNTLNHGWQILSVDTAGLEVNGFGWLDAYDNSRGQNYGEILIFGNEVSEMTRIQAEAYLADRWGLPYPAESRARIAAWLQSAKTNRVEITGATSLSVTNGTVFVTGKPDGTLTLCDARLVIGGEKPPTEADIPTERENLLGWFDPDDRASLHLYGDLVPKGTSYEPTSIRAITDRRDNGFVIGNLMLGGVSARMPHAKVESHDGGPVRTWIDFANQSEGDGSGNNLRVTAYGEGINWENYGSATVVPLSTCTGFVVSDSCRGGGSPVQTSVNDSTDSDIAKRSINAPSTDPVWSAGTADKVKNGLLRLNGETVRYGDGFTGHGEVIVFQPTAAANVGVMGNYLTGQADKPGKSFEWLGEMLFYGTALSAADVHKVESYLMYKWLGKVGHGYRDVSGLTAAGTGAVVAPDASSLPKIDAAFDGSVEVTGSAVFEITIDPETGVVTGGIAAPGVTLDLPEEVTLKVRFTSRPQRSGADHVWTIFGCEGTANPVTWNLQVEGGKIPSGLVLQAEGGVVRLVLPSVGLMLLVR